MTKEKKEKKPKVKISAEALAKSKKVIANLIIVIIILTVIGVGMASIGMLSIFAFMAIGLLPGMVAYITDKRPGRFASKTVIAFNISGISRYMASILSSGSPNQTAISILQDPSAWLMIYGFAAFGWGVVYLIPHIVQLYLEVKATFTIKKLSFFQEKLVDEWGDDIKK